jgi:RNA polymerase-binding transcription factor DksA
MKDTQEFKTKLEEEKATLFSELNDIGIMSADGKTWQAVPPPVDVGEDSDENDMADRFQSYEERTSKLPTLQGRYTDVVDALAKIEAGTYGTCEVSGEEIAIERLRANPAARTTIEHAND